MTPHRLVNIARDAGVPASVVDLGSHDELRGRIGDVGFFIRLFNHSSVHDQCLDLEFCGTVPLPRPAARDLLGAWNRRWHFVRICYSNGGLTVSMKLLAVDVLPALYIRTQFEVWDEMLRDLISCLQ